MIWNSFQDGASSYILVLLVIAGFSGDVSLALEMAAFAFVFSMALSGVVRGVGEMDFSTPPRRPARPAPRGSGSPDLTGILDDWGSTAPIRHHGQVVGYYEDGGRTIEGSGGQEVHLSREQVAALLAAGGLSGRLRQEDVKEHFSKAGWARFRRAGIAAGYIEDRADNLTILTDRGLDWLAGPSTTGQGDIPFDGIGA